MKRNLDNQGKDLRISDAAHELNLSVSTVSRALSGKGRVSEKTRKRVLEWTKQNAWMPNNVLRTLKYGKSGNIVVAVPKAPNDELSPFFHHYVLGVCETAKIFDYEVLVINIESNDWESFDKLIEKNKIDGAILTDRVDDSVLVFLENRGIPHIVVGAPTYELSPRIDYSIENACCEMTTILLENGLRKIAYIGGSPLYLVNRHRQQGFINAFKIKGLQHDSRFMFTGVETMLHIEQSVLKMIDGGVNGVVLGDDVLCSRIMAVLHKLQIKIPEEMQVASLYHSYLTDIQTPQISCIKNDPKAMSGEAARLLINMLQGIEIPIKNVVEHEIVIRDSTRRNLNNK